MWHELQNPRREPQGLQEKFDKLARRASKLGMNAPQLVIKETLDIEHCRKKDSSAWKEVSKYNERPSGDDFQFCFRRFFICECEGSTPLIDGWELVSVIDHTTDPEIGNIIRDVPGKETPPEFRKVPPVCQHCNQFRRRNETFLLLKDGQYKQVGRNCLADFCRSPEMAQQLIHAAEWLQSCLGYMSAAEEEGYGSHNLSYYNLTLVISTTHCLTRQSGYVSKRAAEEEFRVSTSELVYDCLAGRRKDAGLVEMIKNHSQVDAEAANKAIEWIRAKRGDESLSDYMHNLVVVCNQEQIPRKHFGLACSLIPTWMRAMNAAEEQKIHKDSQHFGEVKKRYDLKLKVVGFAYLDGTFGVTTFMKLADDDGNIAIWKASGERDVKVGERYAVKATVKGHSEYKGVKQTELTRCKMEPLKQEEEHAHQQKVVEVSMGATQPKGRILMIGASETSVGIHFVLNDGGREAAGHKGLAGDCATRAIAIASGKPYQEVYDAINDLAKSERRGKRKKKVSNARTGVFRVTSQKYLESLGFKWVPTMKVGQGCKVHLRADELPKGRIIVKVSRHLAAVIDGVLHDTYDCSRNGTRCVYGYYLAPQQKIFADAT